MLVWQGIVFYRDSTVIEIDGFEGNDVVVGKVEKIEEQSG